MRGRSADLAKPGQLPSARWAECSHGYNKRRHMGRRVAGSCPGFARSALRPRKAHMTPASIELDELQLVPYRAPSMLVLTCSTARDASYWRVAELTRRSIASFTRATGSRETTRRGQHARCQAKSGIAFFRIFLNSYFLKKQIAIPDLLEVLRVDHVASSRGFPSHG